MSEVPWRNEHPLTESLASEILREQLPELPLQSVRYLSEGWDSQVFEVDDAWIFRFPKRKEVEACLLRECALLPLLAPCLPLPVPGFRFQGEASERFPFRFVGYPRLSGKQLSSLRPEQVGALLPWLAEQMGPFLSALHTFPLQEAARAGVEATMEFRTPSHMWSRAREALPSLQAVAPPALLARCERFLAEEERVPPFYTGLLCLQHSDLSGEHILIDSEARRVTGIIDWGDVCLGEPALDFAGLFAVGGAPLLDAVLSCYTAPFDDTFLRTRAQFFGTCLGFFEVHYGASTEHSDSIQRGLDSLVMTLGE